MQTIYTTVFLYTNELKDAEVKNNIQEAMEDARANKWHKAIHPGNLVGRGRLVYNDGYIHDYIAYSIMEDNTPVPNGLHSHILEAIDSTVSMNCDGPYKQVSMGEFMVDILWWPLVFE